LHYLHNNVLVIDQSEYIEDRPVPGPFPAFPMTKREKPWERGCQSDSKYWVKLYSNILDLIRNLISVILY
jgi:hypothetical protein